MVVWGVGQEESESSASTDVCGFAATHLFLLLTTTSLDTRHYPKPTHPNDCPLGPFIHKAERGPPFIVPLRTMSSEAPPPPPRGSGYVPWTIPCTGRYR